MKLKYFTIEFNSPEKVYVTGNKLEGVVKIGFEKPTKMKCKSIVSVFDLLADHETNG